MPTFVIEEMDEALISDLTSLAARNGLKVDVQARQLLRGSVPSFDRADLLARLDAIAAMTPKGVEQIDSVALLREDRQR